MINFLKGIVVGLGGVAPGLSGSVLLIIFGLYQKTLDALGTLVVNFKKNVRFLLPSSIFFIVLAAVGAQLPFSIKAILRFWKFLSVR